MNAETLKEAEGWAELFFGLDQLAVLLDIPVEELQVIMEDPGHPLAKAITRGRLLSEAELRRSIMRLAKQGSSPAQAMAVRLLESMQR